LLLLAGSARGSVLELGDVGMLTPSEGGTKLGRGALIADGAMRDWRICASDERIAPCMACFPRVRNSSQDIPTYIFACPENQKELKKVAIVYMDDTEYQNSRLIVQSTRSLRAQIARNAPRLVANRPLAHPSVGG